MCICVQGVRDVRKIKQVIESKLKGKQHISSDSSPPLSQPVEDDYIVTMAVLTVCLGKKVPISRGNIMMATMAEAMGRQASSHEERSNARIELSARVDNVRVSLASFQA